MTRSPVQLRLRAFILLPLFSSMPHTPNLRFVQLHCCSCCLDRLWMSRTTQHGRGDYGLHWCETTLEFLPLCANFTSTPCKLGPSSIHDDTLTFTRNDAPVTESRADMRHSEGIQVVVSKIDVEPHAPGTPPLGLPQMRGEILAANEVTVRSDSFYAPRSSAHMIWAR
jgi:hypothetical protein